MTTVKTGSCACGEFSYEVTGDPMGLAVCHCTACKKRTGSAFGMGCFFPKENLKIQGEYKEYTRIADSERSVTHRFCTNCGTTIMWTAQAMPNGIAVAGGSFDDPNWITPPLHAWGSKALPWFQFPEGVNVFAENPNKKVVLKQQ
ncbi:GFA family protein [Pseudoalteromonas luteoviolacea]|uniref:GFA family protein n=1 Tax=Pseudoalteromonas luteoviolacea TaxID=43657 RepID=UPI001B3675B0|nr:GFA family protein [Pseudoalteromonas luteoviolacea]MBQ4834801.1 GFA family protein [Pseudoalteromonas luteoviolacea]